MSQQQIRHQHSTTAGGTPLNAKLPFTFTAGVAYSKACCMPSQSGSNVLTASCSTLQDHVPEYRLKHSWFDPRS
jgi:hypothetical protein